MNYDRDRYSFVGQSLATVTLKTVVVDIMYSPSYKRITFLPSPSSIFWIEDQGGDGGRLRPWNLL